jgi:transposase
MCHHTEARYMMYVGIDLGVDACSASIVDEQGVLKTYLEFSNEENGWKELMNAMGTDVKIAMEAGSAAYPIHDYLVTLGYQVSVGHPAAIKAITQSKSKTDEKDSLILAQLLRMNYLPLAYIPSPGTLRTRSLLRMRRTIGEDMTCVKNRIHSFLTVQGLRPQFKRDSDIFGATGLKKLHEIQFGDQRDCIFKVLLDQLASLDKQKKELNGEIAKLSIKNDQVVLLMTIPGIDFYSALIILNEMGDITRFSACESLCMYSGLVPSVRNSAETIKMGRITKRGPSALRWILTIVVDGMMKFDNPIRQFYRRIARRKKSKKLAHVAAARKVLVMIYHILKNNEPCRWAKEGLTERKLKNLRRACQRKVLNA